MLPTQLFDFRDVLTAVRVLHLGWAIREPNDYIAEPVRVAERALAYTRWLLRRFDSEVTAADLVTGTYGGALIYATERYGYNYTSLARLTTKPIADLVTGIAGDSRLDIPRRRLEQLGRLDGAPLLSQCARFAELMSVAEQLVGLSEEPTWLREKTAWGGPNYVELESWSSYAHDAAGVMARKLFINDRFARARDKFRQQLEILYERAKIRKAARRAQLAAALEQAAGSAVAEQPQETDDGHAGGVPASLPFRAPGVEHDGRGGGVRGLCARPAGGGPDLQL